MIRRLLANPIKRDKIAVIEDGREIRIRELLQKTWAIRPLLPQGSGENIAVFLPNGGDYIAAFWGTVMAGMTAFPMNVLMTEHEIPPLLIQASVRTIITITSYQHFFEKISKIEALPLKMIFMDKLDSVASAQEYETANIDTDKPMMLINTSGTTGNVKIVQLSERNVEASMLGYLDKLNFRGTAVKDVRYTLAAPFSSIYGMMVLSACLLRSFPIVVLDHPFTLDALFRAAEKYKITHYEGSSSTILLMENMAGRPIPYDIHTLKYFGFGGSKVSGGIIEKVFKAYPGTEFYQGYGMTEAAPLISKHQQAKLTKTNSVGTAIRGLEIAVEAADEIIHTPYIKGEIVVRGANVMLGYLDNQQETDHVLRNGYLYTGDIGYLDEEGYLYICGRKKSMIIVRGFKVHPEEVEACILNSQLVRDCFVYGQADENGNETVCADIVLTHTQTGEEEIRLYCNEHLAEYKRPRRISFCKSIRKNDSGKTQRR